MANARGYYQKAAGLPAGKGLSMRHLARVSLAQGRVDEGREFLHQALLHDPKDAFSLNLLARLYLDAGEDPAIAEVLARQSAALRPDQKQFWKDLARALEMQGKTEEARQALGRA
jgi:predicted Zn-dependent protease